MIKDNIFRGYDIRGVYPAELNENAVYYTTAAFCELYPQAKKIALARDPRPSSPVLWEAAKKAFLEYGRDIIDLGIAPDPLWYFSIFHYNYDGGLMITGSHNPPDQNGLTYHARQDIDSASEELMGETLQTLRHKAQELESKGKIQTIKNGSLINFDPTDDYIDYIASKIQLKRPLKIVLDSGNGSCGYLPEKLFKKLGCQTITVNGDFNGTFPNHLPDPYLPETRKILGEKVKECGADIGFAYDTDGDRVAISDSQGRAANGDDTLLMLARDAVTRKKGVVVHCVRVSKAFIDDMKQLGATTVFSVSHHNAIRANVKKYNAVFGGEITFHYAFPLDYYLVDDAVFASVELAKVASSFDNFAAYVDSLPHYFASPELNIECDDEIKFNIIANLQEYLRKNHYNFIDVDGARINFDHGWALARCSNTAPLIKCKFEGETLADLKEIEQKALQIFKNCGIPINSKHYEFLNI